MAVKKKLSAGDAKSFLETLQSRFEKNMHRHKGLEWKQVQERLVNEQSKLWALHEMERTGGAPDVVAFDKATSEYSFYDCSPESPDGRRSVCYDKEGLDSRKEHKPASNAVDMAAELGIQLLSEEQYRYLQQFGPFDLKTSSWIATPAPIRKLGGALFADYRYGQVFVYHNGAQSYYGARGFRGCLAV